MMLQYKTLYGHKTKRLVFDDVFVVADSASLEQLKELSAKRRLIEESINKTSNITEATAREMCRGVTARHEQDIQRLEQYLPLLENLIVRADLVGASQSLNRWISELKVRWTSTLIPTQVFRLQGPKFFQIDSLKYELGMSLFVYAVILRERALEVLAEDVQQSTFFLKKAAGVYSYLSSEILPSLEPILPPDRPPEVTTTASLVMSLVCLAEAQGIAIKKAEDKQMSAGALSKLHFGIFQFLEEASRVLQAGFRDCKDVSGSFQEYISGCCIVHELRSARHLAESYKQSEQMGIAIGLLRRVVSQLPKSISSKESWQSVVKKEVLDVDKMLKSYEETNAFGWRQKVPLDFELPPLEGTKIATPTPYEPQRWEREILFKS